MCGELLILGKSVIRHTHADGAAVAARSDFALQMHRVFTTPSELKVMNEDCLFLNVWTPGTDGKKRR